MEHEGNVLMEEAAARTPLLQDGLIMTDSWKPNWSCWCQQLFNSMLARNTRDIEFNGFCNSGSIHPLCTEHPKVS